jgi:rhodanese-related sulfurtransferase
MSKIPAIMPAGILRALFVVLFVGLAGAASADEHPVWWGDALHEGEREHYGVFDYEDLQEAMDQSDTLLLDVRPDYEFERGHIPGSRNFEFHPGHALDFPPQKREAFKELVGPDKDRLLVIYCRNFR